MKKKGFYAKLGSSVAEQNVQAKDKFDNADLVAAIATVKKDQQQSLTASETPTVVQVTPYASNAAERANRTTTEDELYGPSYLPIEKVKDHPRNARQVYDPAQIDEMATSIARDGQHVPVIVMPDPENDGFFLLIEGRYRKRALISLGRDKIFASVIEPLSDLEAYRLSLLLNDQRNGQTTLDNAMSWKSMLDDGTYKNQDHIAEHLNIKQGTVSKTLAFLDLPARVISIIKTRPGSFGLRIAQEMRQLAKILPEETMESIAEQVRDEKFSVRDLEKMRERKERDPVSRERSRAYPLQWRSVALGSIREFDDGRLKMDLINAPEDLRNRVIDAVKKILTDSTSEEST